MAAGKKVKQPPKNPRPRETRKPAAKVLPPKAPIHPNSTLKVAPKNVAIKTAISKTLRQSTPPPAPKQYTPPPAPPVPAPPMPAPPKRDAIKPQTSKFVEMKLSPMVAVKTVKDVPIEEEKIMLPACTGLRNFLQQTSNAISRAVAEDSEEDEDDETPPPDEDQQNKFLRISYSSKKSAKSAKTPQEETVIGPANKQPVQIIDVRKIQAEKKNAE